VLGKLHILFNLSTAIPFYVFLLYNGYDYNIILASSIILIIFSNFPDIDINNPKKLFAKIVRNVFYFLFILYAILNNKRESIKHRGITHSIQGWIFFSVIIFILWLLIIQLPIEVRWLNSILIPLSAIIAYALHLIGDAITKEGVDFLMNGKKIRGIIRVGKTDLFYAPIYTFFQLSSLAYTINSLKLDMIPVLTSSIFILFILIPILLSSYKKRF